MFFFSEKKWSEKAAGEGRLGLKLQRAREGIFGSGGLKRSAKSSKSGPVSGCIHTIHL